jgi:hypothetical protein
LFFFWFSQDRVSCSSFATQVNSLCKSMTKISQSVTSKGNQETVELRNCAFPKYFMKL